MDSVPSVSIILVNYNTRDMTLDCLKSVYKHVKYPDFEVILVDNASVDGSVAAIRESFPQVKLLAMDENLGFGAANNLAAKRSRGDYILLLNTDTLLIDDAVTNLMEFAKSTPKAGLWGGRTLYADGSLNPTSCWGQPTLWSLFCSAFGLLALFPNSPVFNTQGYGGWQRDTIREVDIITGCLVLVERKIWEKLEGFDPIFFMYGEDADLSLRAKAMGCRPMITPNATIVHYCGASEPMLARKETRILASKVTVLQRHWRGPKRALGLLLIRALPYTKALGYSAPAALGRCSSKAELWRAVVARRSEWILGFEAPVSH